MTQLPTVQNRSLPTPINGQMENLIRRIGNALFGGADLPAGMALTPATRGSLEVRKADLEGWLMPVGEGDARKAVAAVLAVMPVQGGKGSPEDAVRVQNLYIRALADLPYFALRHACAAALKGQLGSPTWAPTPGEIRAAAERHAEPLTIERRQVTAALEARVSEAPVDPDRKAALLRAADDFVSGSRMAEQGERRGRMSAREIADAEALAAMMRTGRDPRPMPKMSPALRKILGMPEEMPEPRFHAEGDAA